ncbi:MAG: porin [Micavibrio sp.]
MKKLLLTTALVGVAFVATPAMAEVSLGLGGHFKGYMTWHDQDEATGFETNTVDILRETEIHFTGETTLDNGLTVGFHAETEADGGVDGFEVEESYAYFAGNWGRVNFGAEDGANYLLQVAAPAADSNVDGIRQYISPINYDVALGQAAGTFAAAVGEFALDYASDASGYADKLTYISPVFNGFQAGVSYTPDTGSNDGYAQSFGVRADDEADEFGAAYEGAVRYEGQFNAVRLALGAGYTHAELEEDTAGAPDMDDRNNWNVGANLGFGPFNVGAAYVTDNNGLDDSSDSDTWVVGADYTTGPFVLGASYLSREDEGSAGDLGGTAGEDLESDRYSGGVTYTYGPGMSFRGSVHHVEHDVDGGDDFDATTLLVGTQIGF